MLGTSPTIAMVTRKSRLSKLKKRMSTAGQVAFSLQTHRARMEEVVELAIDRGELNEELAERVEDVARGASYEEYEDEDTTYDAAISRVHREIDLGHPIQVVPRERLPTYDFGRCVAVVVVGQDGLVANTAKYVGDLPIIAVNPDRSRNDGVLLPFGPRDARAAVQRVLSQRSRMRRVTLAEVSLNDGQRMLAFNDLFIGAASHVSARYTIQTHMAAEPQSSSGVLVSTGAGSTGWMSSVFNMATGVARSMGAQVQGPPAMKWEDRALRWAVREPFISKQSKAGLICGQVEEGQRLVLESLMPEDGVIFSDGIESDYLHFDSGTVAQVGVASQQARLVVG